MGFGGASMSTISARMWSACIVKNHGTIFDLSLRLILPFGLGFVLSALMLGLVLAGSDGAEPRGVCMFVAGDGGLLPLDPNTGGTYAYSCNLNVPLAALYVSLPGLFFSLFLFHLPGALAFAGSLARRLIIGGRRNIS